MKKQIVIQEVEGEGFEALIGKPVLVFCAIYNWHGTLVGVNDKCILLENPSLVFETGAFTQKNFSDVQKLPSSELRLSLPIEAMVEWPF